MSVASHLGINLAEYDRQIRTFIPGYDEMLDAAARTLSALPPQATIVELGIGTGALARRCVAVAPEARLVGIDGDPGILAAARRRLKGRVPAGLELVDGNFERILLPRCHAIVASLALHHVRTKRAKRRLYSRCFDALARGGVLVNADAQPASAPAVAAIDRETWIAFMARSHGEARARQFLLDWAAEDVYFTLNDERAMLEQAGFRVDVSWRRGSFAVVVGTK